MLMFATEFVGPYTVALAVIVLVVIVVLTRASSRRLSVQVGQIKAHVEDVKQTTDGINQAVNCTAPGEPTLKESIQALRRGMEGLALTQSRQSEKVDRLATRLQRHLAIHDNPPNPPNPSSSASEEP